MKNIMIASMLVILFGVIGSTYGLTISINPIIVAGNVVGYNTNVTGTGITNGLLNYSSNIDILINGLPLNVTYTPTDIYNNGKFFKVINLNKVNKIYNISIGEPSITNTTLNYTINAPSKLNITKTLGCGQSYNNTNYAISINTIKCVNKVYNIKYPFNYTNSTYNFSINIFPDKLNINRTLLINQNYTNKTFNITLKGMSSNTLDNLTIFNYTYLENQYKSRYMKGCNFTIIKDNFSYCAVGLPQLFYGSVISNKNMTEGWSRALTLFINNVTANYTNEKEIVSADSNQIALLNNNLTSLRNGLVIANQVSESYSNLINTAGEVALLVAIFIIILIIYNEHRKKNIITAKRI